MRALYALNQRWIEDPRFKHAERVVPTLTIAPPELAARLDRVHRAAPSAAVAELESLFDITLALVEQHTPAFDVTAVRAWLRRCRAVLEEPD